MQTSKSQGIIAFLALGILGVGGTALWWQAHEKDVQKAAQERLVYKTDGYGGFVAPVKQVDKMATAQAVMPVPSPTASAVPEPLTIARAAYASGDYKQAEQQARRVIVSASTLSPRPVGVAIASAQHLMAFAAARQGDLKTARTRFAQARKDAEATPQTAPPPPPTPGELPGPTLAEDSAYQHAACTMGLGDKAGAERELIQFMRDFPESSLVHGAMRRIARLHGGDIPKEAEIVWKQAQGIQQKAQEKRDRDAALCGPEAIAELLQRRGESVSVETLATEAKTTGDGSSLDAMQQVLRKHGFAQAQGVRLTLAGLKEQSLPVIALVQPGHFVLVERIADDGRVTLWDSSERVTLPGTTPPPDKIRTISATEWQQLWLHTALTTGAVVGNKTAPQATTTTFSKTDDSLSHKGSTKQ